MAGILLLLGFLGTGYVICNRLFASQKLLVRCWLGLSLGCILMMWLPSLLAFALNFTVVVQYVSLSSAVGLASFVMLFVKPTKPTVKIRADEPQFSIKAVLSLLIPFILLSLVLQYTHDLRPVDGGYNVGQSTYGDLNLHVGIATGLRDAAFPPMYTILPGTKLSYPFLVDAMSSSMYMLGTPLNWSFVLPGALMMSLVFLGFMILAWEITKSNAAVILATLLFFLNGGFGFMYMLDQVFKDSSRFFEIFTGWYKAPANFIDENVRWSNIIVDMILPQRTLMAGWVALIPSFWLLNCAIKTNKLWQFALLGFFAGAMPMIHTHSFLALGITSIVWMILSLVASKPERRGRILINFLVYGVITVSLALPQLILWTFGQASGEGFIEIWFNWVNNTGHSLIDGYFWFWIKNIGPVALLIIPALLDSKGKQRAIAIGAFAIFIIAEIIVFQPNKYDNNKLFYVWYMLILPVVASYLVKVYKLLKDVRGRAFLAAIFIGVSITAGVLSVIREVISDFQLYSAGEVLAAQYVDENAPKDSTFATSMQHKNPMSTLAGRNIVCGTSSYLYFHGLNYSANQEAAKKMFESPTERDSLFLQYNVDYLFSGSFEQNDFEYDDAELVNIYPVFYQNDEVIIYAVSQRAKELLK